MTQPIFSGSIPEAYDTHLGPLLFEFYGEDLGRRVASASPGAVLETSCGTGISTAHLSRALGEGVPIVATDVSEEMLGVARARRGDLPGVRFEAADATDLPYDDGSFDALANQFGLMFFPDKLQGMREAHRVLRPGGRLVFNVWDDVDQNPYVQVTLDALTPYFESSPPDFIRIPFSCSDPDPIRRLLADAGFADVEIEPVSHVSERPSSVDVARGLVSGNPTVVEVEERASASVEEVVAAVADALGESFGRAPFRAPMQALVITARR